jgi:hypothetical protein
MVSDNPSGRFGARGRLAHDLLDDAPWHDYYGPGSPLDRLCRPGGRVLRLGASPDTTTVLHFAEYLADVPNKQRVRRTYRCQGADGLETRVIECLDDEHGIVDWPGEDYFRHHPARILGDRKWQPGPCRPSAKRADRRRRTGAFRRPMDDRAIPLI